jgi:hypothetical protein
MITWVSGIMRTKHETFIIHLLPTPILLLILPSTLENHPLGEYQKMNLQKLI